MSSLYPSTVDLSDMVRIPAGPLLFGASESERSEAGWDWFPLTSVDVEEFWIDRTPVTYRRYQVFLRETEHIPALRHQRRALEEQFLPYLWNQDRTYSPGLDEMPIVFVTWYEAAAYAEWAGKALPTELEWEKAARGADGRRFPWGDQLDFTRRCNCPEGPALRRVIPLTTVTAFPDGASPYGCLDMMGNAAEWCWNYYYQPVLRTDAHGQVLHVRIPPHGRLYPVEDCDSEPQRSAGRAVRGGSRRRPPVHVAERDPVDPWVCSPDVGFRCVWYPSVPLPERSTPSAPYQSVAR